MLSSRGDKSELERTEATREKTGVFSGLNALHPATGQEIPIWISDFVLLTYGTGAIMAVPAHDERDHAFAVKYGLPIIPVIMPEGGWDFALEAYTGLDGTLRTPARSTGSPRMRRSPRRCDWLEEHGLGEAVGILPPARLDFLSPALLG